MQRVGEIRENQKPTQKLGLKSKVDFIKILNLIEKAICYRGHIEIFAGAIRVQRNLEPYISRSF